MDKPEQMGGKEYFIGNLVTNSVMTTSLFADRDLFFGHQPLEEDVLLRPEWQDYEPTLNSALWGTIFGGSQTTDGRKLGAGCPFARLIEN